MTTIFNLEQRGYWPQEAEPDRYYELMRLQPATSLYAGAPLNRFGQLPGTPGFGPRWFGGPGSQYAWTGRDAAGDAGALGDPLPPPSTPEARAEWEQNQLRALAGSLEFQAYRDAFASIMPLFCLEPADVDRLDWNQAQAIEAASMALDQALHDCGVDWTAEQAAGRFGSTLAVLEGTQARNPEFFDAVRFLVDTYCPNVCGTEEPEPKKGPPWGYILGGGALLALVGIGVYYATRPRKRRNPSRRRRRSRRRVLPRRSNPEPHHEVIYLDAPQPNPIPRLSKRQSDARVRQLRAQGCNVERVNLPNGDVAVLKKCPKRKRSNPTRSTAQRCTRGEEIQSLIFPESKWTLKEAKAWAKAHAYKSTGVDRTSQSVRIRQHAPSGYVQGSFRTIPLGRSGVKAVIGCPIRGREHDKRKAKR